MAEFKSKLLTIAIPTYNRENFLDVCLSHLCPQIRGFEQQVELIVSDNASVDATASVVKKYQEQGHAIQFVRNDENIGAERNFVQCYNLSASKYFWIVGDDDIVLDGVLPKIIALLSSGSYGVINLKPYGFLNDHRQEKPRISTSGITTCSDKKQFVKLANYFLTFISSNIINKEQIVNDVDPLEFVDTSLVQLSWILPALFKAEQNVFVRENWIAGKMDNTGGYQLCDVFAVKLNRIFACFVLKGIDSQYFRVINNKLLLEFFPPYLLSIRRNVSGNSFADENAYASLKKVYSTYPFFWIFTAPVLKLPVYAATIHMYALRAFLVLKKLLFSIFKVS